MTRTSVASLLPIACLILGACGDEEELPQQQPIQLAFALVANGEPISCDGTPFSAGEDDSQVTLTDARFYLSELALLRGDEEVPVTLDVDSTWQDGRVAMLDFENGAGPCANGNSAFRDTVAGVVDAGEYDGVAFTVGVPFDLNHGDAAIAAAPLSYTSMFWSWQGGYKFIRIEANVEGADATRLHLGSTGCQGSLTNITGCARPNRARVSLRGLDVHSDTILVDLAALWTDLTLTQNTPNTALGCMSEPDDPDCDAMMSALGIDPDTGEGGGPQTVFSTMPP